MPHGEHIAELLLDIGAVKLSLNPPFTWTSGLKAPIYCDNRMLYSHPDARDFVVKALSDRVRLLHCEPDVIAGTATAAIGWAALVANHLHLPFVYVRKKSKEHGLQKRIEGDLHPEKHVVVIEDLISTGGSAMDTVTALREEGKGIVTDIVAIMSYGFLSAQEKAQELMVKMHPITDLTTLLKVAVEQGFLEKPDMSRIVEFAKEPEGWMV